MKTLWSIIVLKNKVRLTLLEPISYLFLRSDVQNISIFRGSQPTVSPPRKYFVSGISTSRYPWVTPVNPSANVWCVGVCAREKAKWPPLVTAVHGRERYACRHSPRPRRTYVLVPAVPGDFRFSPPRRCRRLRRRRRRSKGCARS